MSSPFSPIITGNSQIDRIQANVSKAFLAINGPFIGGNLLTGIAVGTSPTAINHGLGRQPQVWVLCDQNTATTVFRTAWNSSSIMLEAGTACVVSLWIN